MSNICQKDCLYCGIRRSNPNFKRYNLSDDEILLAVDFAIKSKYASIVIQGGEIQDANFADRISALLKKIAKRSPDKLGITLSFGEQEKEVFQQWKNDGANRYLLRIESSNKELYNKIHPNDDLHSFDRRVQAIQDLKELQYQVGSGMMIGLPGQTHEDIYNDLKFLKDIDVDMVGMGPFIEHKDTPLYKFKDQLWTKQERFDTTINAIVALRMMMPDINIAAATALQAIDPVGRERALQFGANVIMPNITPVEGRRNYFLYEDKPCTDEGAEECYDCLEKRISMANRISPMVKLEIQSIFGISKNNLFQILN
jgi:biotin synthase